MRKLGIGVMVLLVCGVSGTAFAQEVVTLEDGTTADVVEEATVRAPSKAFEIGVNGVYTQPFGDISQGRDFGDLAKAGGGVGLSLGYRASPYFSVEGVGAFHESTVADASELSGTTTDIRGVHTGIQTTIHMVPYGSVDPYLSLGVGYRMLWIATEGAPNILMHGVQAGSAKLGVDFRVSPDVAIGPMMGADLNVFLFDDGPGEPDDDAVLDDPRPSTFIFAGLGGRFDMGGDRVGARRLVARREMMPTPAAAPLPQPPPPAPAAPPPAPAPDPTPPPSTGIQIDPKILAACKIDQKKAFFEFDSSDLRANDLTTLDAVGTCFASGPLKGRNLTIVGRADPRGTDEYNMKLGRSRAESVREYLANRGVGNGHVLSVSRGEEDATGTEETGWAFDRRVDLRLGDEMQPEIPQTTGEGGTSRQEGTKGQQPAQKK